MKFGRRWSGIACVLLMLTILCAIGMAEGDESSISIDVPKYLTAGQDLTVTLNGTEGYDRVGFELWDRNLDNLEVFHAEVAGTHSFTVPADTFTTWHVYTCCAFGPGFQAESTVFVTGARDEALAIELLTDEIYTNEDCPIAINAPGATVVRVYNVDNPSWFSDFYPENGRDMVCWRSSSGNTSFYARACYDEIDDGEEPEFGGMSNIIEFMPISLGEGTPVDITVPETIGYGNLLPVELKLKNGDYCCEVHVNKIQNGMLGEEVYYCRYDTAGEYDEFTAYVPTAFLEAGKSYCIIVLSHGYGQQWGATDWEDAQFTVTEGTPGVCFEVTPEEVLLHQEVTAVVSVPGASDAYLEWHDGNGIWNGYGWDPGTHSIVETQRFGEVGEAYAILYICDEGSDTFEAWPERIRVTVTSNGRLDEPELDVPMAIDPGEDLIAVVGAVDQADYYFFSVFDRTADQEVYWKEVATAGAVTIPAGVFTPGHNYDVNVSANAERAGLESSYAQKSVLVLDTRDENITIEIGEGDILINEDFEVTIHAPGATFVRLYFSTFDYFCRDVWDDRGEGYDNLTTSIRTDAPTLIYARASYDVGSDPNDMTFGGMSNAIRIDPVALGEGTPADIAVPETIGYGNLLPVELKLKNGDYCCEVHVHTVQNGMAGEEIYNCGYNTAGEYDELTAYVPTAFLEAGQSYCIIALSRGHGQQWGATDWEDARFTVTEGTPEVCFEVTPEEALLHQEVTAVVSVPGASDAYLEWHDGNGIWNGYGWDPGTHSIVETQRFGEVGEAYAILYICDEGSDTFEAWPERIRVTVTSNGRLDEPELEVPMAIDPGEDLIAVVGAVDQADYYFFSVFDRTADQEVYWKEVATAGAVTIPAGIFTPGHSYDVHVSANAERAGLESSYAQKSVFVLDTPDENISIEIGEGEILINEDFEVTIHAPGATFVRLYYISYGEFESDVRDEKGEGYDNITAVANVFAPTLIYARASYDPLSNPDDMTFGGMSNVIRVDPTVLGEGTVPEIALQDTIEVGKLLPVEITTYNDTTAVVVQVFDDGGECMFDQWSPVSNLKPSFTMYVPTMELEPNKGYNLVVSAHGYGENWAATGPEEGRFYVADIDGDPQIDIIVTPENPLVWRDVTLAASVPDASYAYFYWEDELLIQDGYDLGPGCVFLTLTANEAGTYNIYLRASYDDGETEEVVETIEVTFTDNGRLNQPVFNVPEVLYKDEYLAVDIDPVEHAEVYRFFIIDQTIDDVICERESDTNETQVVTASAFEPGHDYYVCVLVEAPVAGYSSNGDGREMSVSAAESGKPVLMLPTSLTTIKAYAFAGTNARKIVVPLSVTCIESGAFAGCNVLECVEFKGDITDIAEDAFAGIDDLDVICDPDSNIGRYADNHGFLKIPR